MESALPQYGGQAREIVVEPVENAEPVTPAVDFQALEGCEPAVGLDQFVDFRAHLFAADGSGRDGIRAG